MLNRRIFLGGCASAAGMAAMPALAHKSYTIPPEHMPKIVTLPVELPAGEIHVEPDEFALYWTLPNNKAIRYAVGIGRGDLYHSGVYTVGEKRKWPDWKPTEEMIRRNPSYEKYAEGVPGGPTNPLGARALYLFNERGRDTLLRIHGTPQPWTIGRAVSNGCARLIQAHIIHLYDLVPMRTRIVLHKKGRMKEGIVPDLRAVPGSSVHS